MAQSSRLVAVSVVWCGADVVTGGHLAEVASASFSTVLRFSLPTLQSEKRIAKVSGNHTPSSRSGELSPASCRQEYQRVHGPAKSPPQ